MPTQTDETDHDGGARMMALLTTATSLTLLFAAGVWWVATSRGGTDAPNAQQQAAVDSPPAPEERAGDSTAATVTAAQAKIPFYLLIVDSPTRAAAVQEQWNESNRLRLLNGSPGLRASVVTVEPGDSDSAAWLYLAASDAVERLGLGKAEQRLLQRATWLYLAASDAASLGREARLFQGLPPIEVIDLREGATVMTASARPDALGWVPECLDAVGGQAELDRDQRGDPGDARPIRDGASSCFDAVPPTAC